MKHKVLCLIDTLRMGGGAERQMAGLAGMLHQQGEDVTVATYHRHKSDDFLEKKYGIRSIFLESQPSPLTKFISVRKYILQNHFDVIIAYKDGPAMISAILKMMGMKSKLIVSERNTTQCLDFRERLKFFLYRWADFIVPNSESQRRFIRDSYPKLAPKVRVITNFTDTHYFKPLANINRGDNDNTLKVLVTARVAPQKNVLGFLDVVKELKVKGLNICIKWFGNAVSETDAYKIGVYNHLQELELEDIITFYPATPDILKEYQTCDIFCLPSYYEGYPNVVCEAMSCGKPILCSNVCDNATIVEDGTNGYLFDPKIKEDVVNKFEMMISLSNEKRIEMGEASRKIAERKFSEKAFVEKYIQLINNN